MLLDDIGARLQTFCEECYSFAVQNDLKPLSSSIAHSSRNPYSGVTFYQSGSTAAGLSNHVKLAVDAFNTRQHAAIEGIYASLFKAIPALDHPVTTISLVVRPSTTKPKISITINEMRLGDAKGQLLITIMEKLEFAAECLANTPKPGDRLFLIGNCKIPAADLNAAYRVWAAIAEPSYFDPSSKCPAHSEIYEVFSEDHCRAAHMALQQ